LKEGECEVCISVLNRIKEKIPDTRTASLVDIEEKIANVCAKPSNEKESKLCYYVDPIKRKISQPLKNGLPPTKVCERLKSESSEICALRYAEKQAIDLSKLDDAAINKLKVSQLKTIFAEKSLPCKDCIEKEDYVRALKAAIASKKDL
jgi:hypothetical protein